MPIKNLTDNDSGFGSGLPLIGRLRKGAEKVEGQQPRDLDYFRVTFEPGYEHLEATWKEMYGEQPDHFEKIQLCGDTTHEAFPTFMEDWNTSGTMLHKCDGEDQIQHWNGSMYITAKTMCVRKVDSSGKQTGCACKQTGRLMIAIPKFIEVTGVFGQFMVVTHSINDILTVYKILRTVEKMVGRVSGIPYTFGRVDKEVSAPNNKKVNGVYQVQGRVRVEKSLFVLYPDQEYAVQTLLPEMTRPALPAPEPRVVSTPYTPSDKPRILGRDNVITLPSPAPQVDGTAALQPAPDAPTPPETKQTGDWATPENLDFIFKRVRTELKDDTLADRDLAGLLGIKESDVRSKVIWDAQFLTGQLAFDSMVEAFRNPDKETPPVIPPVKTSAIVTRAMFQVISEGKSRQSRFVFDVEGTAKQPRIWGREGAKRLLGEDYYADNHFNDMHSFPNIWYEIASLKIEWEVKGNIDPNGDDKTYLVVIGAAPVEDEKPAEPADVPHGKVIDASEEVTEIIYPLPDDVANVKFD